MLAGRRHNEPAMQLLLDAGADINHQDFMGYSSVGEAMLRCDFKTIWFLLERGADPRVGSEAGADVSSLFKLHGSCGVLPDQHEYCEKVVAEFVKRGLITREDLAEADKPKQSSAASGPPGVTVIEHSPGSEAGGVCFGWTSRSRTRASRICADRRGRYFRNADDVPKP